MASSRISSGQLFQPAVPVQSRIVNLASLGLALILLMSDARPAVSQYKLIYNFGGNASVPSGPMVFDKAGNLYGTASGFYNEHGSVFELSPSGGTWTGKELYDFSTAPNASAPVNSVLFDSNGNLYGETISGGSDNEGTVFELKPDGESWNEKVLFSFCAIPGPENFCPQGKVPYGGLVTDANGNLYGSTEGGGVNEGQGGVIFELTPNGSSWTEKILYSFCTQKKGTVCLDGGGSSGSYPLIFDSKGNLYGTGSGGANSGAGVVFELSPQSGGTWTEKVLYNFGATTTDAARPTSGLTMDASGNLYGTAGGGDNTCPNGLNCGTVWELSPQTNGTWTEKVLYSFGATVTDGFGAQGSVTLDAQGNLYGTTFSGGTQVNSCPTSSGYGCGTVFKLTPQSNGTWTETLLHSFPAASSDGANPGSGVILDSAGNLYGTTGVGGTLGTQVCPLNDSELGCGVAFEIVGAAVILPAKATLSTPAPGSILTGSSAAFTWTTAASATGYALWIGTEGAGTDNIFEGGVHDVTSLTVSGLPADGKTLYVRLWTSDSGKLAYNDYTFTEAATMIQGAITSPAPYTALPDASVTFTWSSGGSNATGYALWVGTTGVGSHDIIEGGLHNALSFLVSGLPVNGETVYVRLFTQFGTSLESTDYTYNAVKRSVLYVPPRGSKLSNSWVTFQWTNVNASPGYALWVGTTGPGSHDIFEGGLHDQDELIVGGIPIRGETVYVRLYTELSGTLTYNDYTYVAQ